MARETFNPNISLFVPTGGSTFQPNPNSIVQNDEARGTNHLDFFKFVGRVVGKALYDGQLIDAYFTRSFYKHMLGQPLTYQVRLHCSTLQSMQLAGACKPAMQEQKRKQGLLLYSCMLGCKSICCIRPGRKTLPASVLLLNAPFFASSSKCAASSGVLVITCIDFSAPTLENI